MTATNMEQAREHLERSLELHRAMADILKIALEPIDLASVLERSLHVLISVNCLAIEPRGSVFLADAGSKRLVMKAQVGLPCKLLSACKTVPFGECLCGQVAESQAVVFAEHVDERHVRHQEGMEPHGHYCVPLLSNDVLLGVLTLYLKSGQSYQADEQQFLESAADVLAGVIQRKQAEEALKKSEERFDLAIRGTDAGIWDWNLVTDEVYFSPRWKSMLGYRDHEISNDFSEWERRLHPDDKTRAKATVNAYLSGRAADYEFEHRLRHKDGTYRWILARGAALRDEEGKPYRMVGSHLDITDRVAMEREFHSHEAQLIAARQIQEHIWPQKTVVLPGFDIAGKVFPAEFAAGDHFDYFCLDDGTLVFLLADVAGHGFSSALLMASTHAYIRSLFSTNLEIDQVLLHTNCELMRDTDLFVTMILGCLRPQDRTFVYVNAGHPTAYLLDQAGQVKHSLPSSVPPLAIVEDISFVPSEPIGLEPGDMLVMTTDGVSEARSPAEVEFGIERLLEVARANRELPAEEIIVRLHDAVEKHCGSHGIDDDLTALIIKVDPDSK